MIAPDILARLVPEETPPDGDSLQGSGHPISLWAAYLRYVIWQQLPEDDVLRNYVDHSGFIGTGIFRVPDMEKAPHYDGFPIVGGYQFGVVLFSGKPVVRETYIYDIQLYGPYRAPVINTRANFNLHHRDLNGDGYIAATYQDGGQNFGITAGHIVEPHHPGNRVPVHCPECGCLTQLVQKAPGNIDAAIVQCHWHHHHRHQIQPAPIRRALEGNTVEAHYGQTGKTRCTVMQALSSPSQIKCAAMPDIFLTDTHGIGGDSGSLVSGLPRHDAPTDLIGMYLGSAGCVHPNGENITHGFNLQLQQAADILGIKDLKGNFNV